MAQIDVSPPSPLGAAIIEIAAPLVSGQGLVFNAQGCEFFVLSSPLTSTDTLAVQINLPDGMAAVNAPDINGVLTGLSASVQARIYVGGPTYLFTKTGTASAVNLYANFHG